MLYDPEKEPREKWGRTPREMGESPARNGGKAKRGKPCPVRAEGHF